MEVKTSRCDAVLLQLIVTQFDEHGRPIGEITSQPIKVFRGAAPNFWSAVDEVVKTQLSTPPTLPPAAPGRPKKGSTRG